MTQNLRIKRRVATFPASYIYETKY